MSTTDSFLPDPDRSIRDQDEELAHEVAGDGPDVFVDAGVVVDGAEQTTTDEAPEPLHPTPLFRTPHAGERLTADQLDRDLDD